MMTFVYFTPFSSTHSTSFFKFSQQPTDRSSELLKVSLVSLDKQWVIGRVKRAPHLGCSIEISRDICRYVGMYICRFVYKKYVCQNVWAELRDPNTRMLKVSLRQLKPTCDTRIIHFYYTIEQL